MTSWIVNSVVPFSSISAKAASRKRWTRTSARDRAALRLRDTARSRHAGSVSSSAFSVSSVGSVSLISPAQSWEEIVFSPMNGTTGSRGERRFPRADALVDPPALHHEAHVLGDGDVRRRVARDPDDVGEQ